MAKPTYQDANLLLQVIQFGATIGLPEAVTWFWSNAFIPDYAEFISKYPPGTEEEHWVATICTFWETVGSFYKHGLLNEELLFDCVRWDLGYRMLHHLSGWLNSIRGSEGGTRAKMPLPG